MDAPEYLDLDEIDFTDDLVYSVTSLKNIPELSRRSDGQGEERAPPINWGRGVSSHGGGGIKPTGIADVHSKFRPVKRVSPLKHQPETSDTETDGKAQGPDPHGEGHSSSSHNKEEDPSPSDKPPQASSSSSSLEGPGGGKAKGGGGGGGGALGGALFGELEHYDLDMDEILDVPYIKSSQQMATLPRVPHDKRSGGGGVGGGGGGGGGTIDRCHSGVKTSTLPHPHPHPLPEGLGAPTPYCVLSPVKWSDMRKSKSMDPEFHRQPAGGYDHHSPGGAALNCSSSSSSSVSDADKLLATRAYPDIQTHVAGGGVLQGGQSMMFPLPGSTLGRQDSIKSWAGTRGHGEVDEETKKAHNIINIIREGQISLLPHLAADNLELIRDEEGNNLLHISAAQGHADCLQHLTSLMGEDGLNERNVHQLTPAGLGVKNGHLECVRWMVSETEAIAELSCTREHPSLIHYAARYGQEKVLLWLLQFMQEQAISLDEVDQYANSAVHVAAQYGHLTCIQTLVEYGSNVTVQNQQGERPSQSAERQGHTTCARYLVVVETCMSLASQVVKLTKQLNEQAADRMALRNQVQLLMDPSKAEGTPSRSPSSHPGAAEAWPEMTLTAEGVPGDSHWVLRQRSADSDSVLRQLLGKDISATVCTKEKLSLQFQEGTREGATSASGGGGPGNPPAGPLRRMGLVERRELKLARLKQIMQRSLSESDSDAYPPEEGAAKQGGAGGGGGAPPQPSTAATAAGAGPGAGGARLERPNHLPIAESEETIAGLKKHGASSTTADRKSAFTHASSSSSISRSADGGVNPSPTSDRSDPDADGSGGASGDFQDYNNGQKTTTSPKSALKSPSSRRKTAQNLKLRVTFDEQVVHKNTAPPQQPPQPPQEAEGKGAHGKEGGKEGRTSGGGEGGTGKRPFGAFRSIMESLSGNQNSNNNNTPNSPSVKHSNSQSSPGKRTTDSKSSPGSGVLSKGKNKTSNV